jgi:sigma-B regulation protein RsbU (phosphoserine phosphatase)
MNSSELVTLRSQLTARRERLRTVMQEERQTTQLINLLREVDSALERIGANSYGICEVCNDEIEDAYLRAEPLVRICLSHLSEEQRRAVERDLQLAAQVQAQFLPMHETTLEGWEIAYRYEPVGPLSGDYCDFVKPQESSDAYFFLGDVSGKGVAASLLMSQLHAMFRTLLSTERDLRTLVESVNRLFCNSTHAADYATLVCGRIQATGDIELCNAGHCLPLIVKGGDIQSLDSTGLPLGLFFNAEYRTRTVHLERNDHLLVYSDGVTETRNTDDDEYSEARLSALVVREHHRQADELARVCLEDLARFRGGRPKVDDLSLMILRRIA